MGESPQPSDKRRACNDSDSRRVVIINGKGGSYYYILLSSIESEKMDPLFCPILKKKCIGKICAMAVKLDHFTISSYNVLYQCGLVVTHDSYSLGKPQYIDFDHKETKK